MNKHLWLITQAQIAAGDLDSVLLPLDPEQMPDQTLLGLHGAVRLRVEAATGPADLFAQPQTRQFFRRLHARWPYAGYFLRLKPIRPTSTVDELIDLSLFVAMALCQVDKLTYTETRVGVGLEYDPAQLRQHLAELQDHAAGIGEASGLSAGIIRRREKLINNAVASFFAAGNAFHQNHKRNQQP